MELLNLWAKLVVIHHDVIVRRNIRNSYCFTMELAKKKKKKQLPSNYHMIWQFYTGFISQVYEITILSTLAHPHSWQQ